MPDGLSSHRLSRVRRSEVEGFDLDVIGSGNARWQRFGDQPQPFEAPGDALVELMRRYSTMVVTVTVMSSMGSITYDCTLAFAAPASSSLPAISTRTVALIPLGDLRW